MNKLIKLHKKEKVKTVIRQYILTLLPIFLVQFILISLDFFFMFWLWEKGWWGISLFWLVLIFSFLWFIYRLFKWFGTYTVITNFRVIDVQQIGLFNKVMAEITYSQIEDVVIKIKGFFGTIFHYGFLKIRTAKGKVNIKIENIKKPSFWQQTINYYRERTAVKKAKYFFQENFMDNLQAKIKELEVKDLKKIRKMIKQELETRE